MSGWRVWLVVDRPQGARLASVVYSSRWPAGRPLVAECLSDGHGGGGLSAIFGKRVHPPPGGVCRCGIYGVSQVDRIAPYLDDVPPRPGVRRVLGRVSMWGRVVEGDFG